LKEEFPEGKGKVIIIRWRVKILNLCKKGKTASHKRYAIGWGGSVEYDWQKNVDHKPEEEDPEKNMVLAEGR